jgi:Ser/Thr protein kinase RdoA (MazF antagonist)
MNNSFYNLTPDRVMKSAEMAGFFPTGEYTQLNSYENRVFDIRLEKGTCAPELNDRLIAKFYRPGRWDLSTVQEEHTFLRELRESGIPVIAPFVLENKSTIQLCDDILVSFFPKALGRIPQELRFEDFKKIGRTLARIHNIGQLSEARHRPSLGSDSMGWPALEILEDWVAPEVWGRYKKSANEILNWLDEALKGIKKFRIHGDCHRGNLLLTQVRDEPEEFFLLDFDDFCRGPAVQDFWMLFSGDLETFEEEENTLLSGYEELREFNYEELQLIPALRGLRIIHYAGWIAKRWEDPSFPRLFPSFRDYNYWAHEVEALENIAWTL